MWEKKDSAEKGASIGGHILAMSPPSPEGEVNPRSKDVAIESVPLAPGSFIDGTWGDPGARLLTRYLLYRRRSAYA